MAPVSVEALRHYDRLGLLEPARTDPLNGYEYYASEQLPRLNRNLVSKDLGFSFEQVSLLLDGDLSMVQIRKMLEMKRDEVGLRVVAEQRRLALLQTRLEQVEREDGLLAYEVALKRVDAQRVASVGEVLPRYSDVGRLFGELGAYRQRHGIVATAWTAVCGTNLSTGRTGWTVRRRSRRKTACPKTDGYTQAGCPPWARWRVRCTTVPLPPWARRTPLS